jgi:hypothetical protein
LSLFCRPGLQNSADPAVWWGNPGLGFLDNVHRQGAGMLDIDDAILATTRVEPGKIATGESEFGPTVHTLMIENTGFAGVTYDLSFVNALSTLGTFAPLGFYLSDASVGFSAPSVFVPAGGTASVQATIYPASGPDLGTYGGYIVLTPQGGGQVFRVPFAGFVGDYQALPIFDANPYGLPWSVGCESPCTMVGGDVAEFWVNLGHQVRKFRMEVFDANSGKAWHRAYVDDYVGRSQAENFIFSFPWDGTTFNGNKTNVVPDGDYVVVISVLKALGDDDNPDHWETWTSPVITIDRP